MFPERRPSRPETQAFLEIALVSEKVSKTKERTPDSRKKRVASGTVPPSIPDGPSPSAPPKQNTNSDIKSRSRGRIQSEKNRKKSLMQSPLPTIMRVLTPHMKICFSILILTACILNSPVNAAITVFLHPAPPGPSGKSGKNLPKLQE